MDKDCSCVECKCKFTTYNTYFYYCGNCHNYVCKYCLEEGICCDCRVRKENKINETPKLNNILDKIEKLVIQAREIVEKDEK